MNILFVIGNLYTCGNGLSGSVRRTIAALRQRGHSVRVLSAGQDSDGSLPDYPLRDGRVPVFGFLVKKQGYAFAKVDRAVIAQAVSWADVIHLAEPFYLEILVCRAAKRQGVPCVATYHLHPENLFSSVGLRKSRWFNGMTMRVWRSTVFNGCRIVQCPTQQVRERLTRWHFRPELRVISNGITEASCRPVKREPPDPSCTRILSVGRFSREKDQLTLLRAMAYSRHAETIQLDFAGQGPTEPKLRRAAQKLVDRGILKHPPTFGFYGQEELRGLFARADLYIHCATVEVEGMSCMEAICTGIVPIVAEGPLTATSQFTHHPKSRFPEADPKALAQRIDYWIEHPEERLREAQSYVGVDRNYRFSDTVRATEAMYRDALGTGTA